MDCFLAANRPVRLWTLNEDGGASLVRGYGLSAQAEAGQGARTTRHNRWILRQGFAPTVGLTPRLYDVLGPDTENFPQDDHFTPEEFLERMLGVERQWDQENIAHCRVDSLVAAYESVSQLPAEGSILPPYPTDPGVQPRQLDTGTVGIYMQTGVAEENLIGEVLVTNAQGGTGTREEAWVVTPAYADWMPPLYYTGQVLIGPSRHFSGGFQGDLREFAVQASEALGAVGGIFAVSATVVTDIDPNA